MSYVLGLLASAMSGPAETGDNLAQQFESLTSNICSAKSHVRFTPESGHVRCS